MFAETDRLNLNLLKTDKKALQRLAANEGESMSVVLRRIIRKELIRHRLLQNKKNETGNSWAMNK